MTLQQTFISLYFTCAEPLSDSQYTVYIFTQSTL